MRSLKVALFIFFPAFSALLAEYPPNLELENPPQFTPFIESQDTSVDSDAEEGYQESPRSPVSTIFAPISLQEALTSTVYRQLEIKLAELNISFQKGAIQSSAGPFDPVFNDQFSDNKLINEQLMPANIKSDFKGNIFNNFFSASKATRLGTLFSVQSDLTRINSLFQFLTGQIPDQRLGLSNILVRVEQALLRGGWNGIDYQLEKAAIRELDAVKYDVLQTISGKVRDTAVVYWSFVGAIKELNINKEVLENFLRLKGNLQKLINVNERAVGDIYEVLASIEIKKNNVIASQYNLYLNMQQLLFAMGMLDTKLCCNERDFDQIIDVYPEFPDIESDLRVLSSQTNGLVGFAINERFDVLASLIREEVAALTLKGYKNSTLPQLNVFSEVAPTDFKTGSRAKNLYSDLYLDHPQIDWRVGLSFSMPLYNDAALGNYKQSLAQYHQSLIQTSFLKEQLIRDVLTIAKNQVDLAMRIRKVNGSVAYYEKVVADQYEKLAAGFTTLFELISYENNLTDTRLLQNNLYTEYNSNLANLRFFSGTLIRQGEMGGLTIEDPTKIPLINRVQEECL